MFQLPETQSKMPMPPVKPPKPAKSPDEFLREAMETPAGTLVVSRHALADNKLTPTELRVLLALSAWRNADGVCHPPSQDHVERLAAVTDDALDACIGRLLSAGWLAIEPVTQSVKDGDPHGYKLLLPRD